MRAGAFLSVFSPVFADIDNDGKGDIGAVGSLPPSGTVSTLVFIKGSNTGLTTVGSSEISGIPDKFILEQNYPNPFNPVTVIRYSLTANSPVELKIYNLLGKEVAALVNEVKNTGTHSVEWNAAGFPSGIYFYTISANDFKDTKRMILLK